MTRYRFRPRSHNVPILAGTLGAILFLFGITGWAGDGTFATGAGAVGLALVIAHFASPVWRFRVLVDDDTLTVSRGDKPKFRLRFADIVRVVRAASDGTFYVDSGDPTTSLLVPGKHTPAPYRIENMDALYRVILARVAPERLETVDSFRDAQVTPDTTGEVG